MVKKDVGFNVSSFIKGSKDQKQHKLQEIDVVETIAPPPKKKAVSKKDNTDVAVVNPAELMAQTSMSYIQENIPYANAYNETNQQLNDVIAELTMLERDILGDIQMVRANKTLKSKYMVLGNMTENAVGVINAKLSAIKEKNKTINDVNNLEIRRIKELKMQTSEEDDNVKIANLYNAFVNTPVGMGPGMLGPSVQDVMLSGAGQDLTYGSIGSSSDNNWEGNLDPAQRRMLLEARGQIETVVVYDEATGNRHYAVVDKQTRQPMQGIETPDQNSVYDLDINVRGGVAKDPNRNVIYPLMVINSSGNPNINEY